MKLEDEEALKDEVSEAAENLSQVCQLMDDAESRYAQARDRVTEWMEEYG